MAQLATESIGGEPTVGESYMDYWRRAEKELHDSVVAARERYAETGNIVGLNYKAPYADSYAEYIVTKARPLTLTHVSLGDGWGLPAPHIRGINKQDIIDNNRLQPFLGRR